MFCGIHIAHRAGDRFGMLLAAGITFMISIQAFVNMGVAAGLLPCKGMPLPFISYGGSNLLLMLVCVGLLLSISRHTAEPAPARSNPFDVSPKLSHE
jgi:cell division protein FtsW